MLAFIQQYMAALPGVILSTGLYPGEVQYQQGNSYEVSTMSKSGGYVMAIQKDNILHTRDIIKQKLAIPTLLSIEEGFTHSVTSQSDT